MLWGKFIGEDGSMGLTHGEVYPIRTKVKSLGLFRTEAWIWVEVLKADVSCPYSSLESLIKNWEILGEVEPYKWVAKKEPLKGRKYLNDLGASGTVPMSTSDGRQAQWKEERDIYGFDERETWGLEYTMVELLYERIMMYKEIAINDFDHHTIEVDGEEHTQGEWIDEIIKLSQEVIKDGDLGMIDTHGKKQRIWTIWKELHPVMWW